MTCYAPVVTKDATASYDETHIWSIVKTVNPTSQSGIVGDVLPWTWTVVVSETPTDDNFAVSGTIFVKNPSPDEPMTVNVADTLNDGRDRDSRLWERLDQSDGGGGCDWRLFLQRQPHRQGGHAQHGHRHAQRRRLQRHCPRDLC